MAYKMKGIFKGLMVISHIFVVKEHQMEIGFSPKFVLARARESARPATSAFSSVYPACARRQPGCGETPSFLFVPGRLAAGGSLHELGLAKPQKQASKRHELGLALALAQPHETDVFSAFLRPKLLGPEFSSLDNQCTKKNRSIPILLVTEIYKEPRNPTDRFR